MNQRLWILIAAVPILGIIYITGFTDWLNPAPIEVIPSVRAILPKKAYGTAEREFAGVYPVIFTFDAHYKLTEIWVEESGNTNAASPKIVWHLKSKKGSNPVKAVLYGRDLDDMDPAPGSASPPPALRGGVPYKLVIRAGRRRGEATFSTREMADLRPNF